MSRNNHKNNQHTSSSIGGSALPAQTGNLGGASCVMGNSMINYLPLSRKLLKNKLWQQKPFSHGQAWVDILLNTNYTDNGYWKDGQYIQVARGQVGISVKGWGERWGWNRSKVRTYLNNLQKAGMIEINSTNKYTLITVINYEVYNAPVEKSPSNDHQVTIKPTQSNKDNKEKKEYTDDFESFWSGYPRKDSKYDAFKAWDKLSPDSSLIAKMVNRLELFKQSEDWKRDGGKYIPYGATWINGRRWDDEIKDKPKQKYDGVNL